MNAGETSSRGPYISFPFIRFFTIRPLRSGRRKGLKALFRTAMLRLSTPLVDLLLCIFSLFTPRDNSPSIPVSTIAELAKALVQDRTVGPTRLNFEFSEERIEELKQLQSETGTESMKDLVNNAFTLLEWAVKEAKDGNEIAAVNGDHETYCELVVRSVQRDAKKYKKELAATK